MRDPDHKEEKEIKMGEVAEFVSSNTIQEMKVFFYNQDILMDFVFMVCCFLVLFLSCFVFLLLQDIREKLQRYAEPTVPRLSPQARSQIPLH